MTGGALGIVASSLIGGGVGVMPGSVPRLLIGGRLGTLAAVDLLGLVSIRPSTMARAIICPMPQLATVEALDLGHILGFLLFAATVAKKRKCAADARFGCHQHVTVRKEFTQRVTLFPSVFLTAVQNTAYRHARVSFNRLHCLGVIRGATDTVRAMRFPQRAIEFTR